MLRLRPPLRRPQPTRTLDGGRCARDGGRCARTAAAAQARADDAFALADGKVDPAGAASAAREVTADWAEAENPDPIPAPKLVNVVNAHEDIVNVLDGRLPGLPVAMRLGWSQTRTFTELDFDRPLPPLGGSVAGLSGGLAAPPFPPGLASDPTLFFGIWLSGDPDVVEIAAAVRNLEANDRSQSIPERWEASLATTWFPTPGFARSKVRFFPSRSPAHALSRNLTWPRMSAIRSPITRPRPAWAAGLPGLYEADSVAIGGTTALIAGNVVCPPSGAIEFFCEGLTGLGGGGVASARIPSERIRRAESALTTAYSNDSADHAGNFARSHRGIGVAVQANTNFLLLAAQAPGNYFVRIVHLEG